MQVLTRREAQENKLSLVRELRDAVFIHPTDTVYGIGCDATKPEQVERLRDAKRQHERPVSVIIPSHDWIDMYCDVPEQAQPWLDKLPGPYTFILPLNDKGQRHIADLTNLATGTIGVRRPDHWFTDVVEAMQTPVVTTSANISGRDYIKEIDGLDEQLKPHVDIAIDDGNIDGTPSTIVDCAAEEPETIRD